jgi:hypothetical protein
MTILNDDSRAVNKLEASLTGDARVIIYDRQLFIVQATAHFYIENIIFLFFKTSYLYEEVNCTEPSLSVSIPWLSQPSKGQFKTIDTESLQNRLLKVCYVRATSACLPRLLFILFLLWPLTVLMKQTRQAVCTVK